MDRTLKFSARFGWFAFIKTIAESKVFDKPGFDSLDSVLLSDLYKVLRYADYCHGEQIYNTKVSEAHLRQQKIKSK